jgi:hypothetical protein
METGIRPMAAPRRKYRRVQPARGFRFEDE